MELNSVKQPTFLEFLPVSLFGGVMGLCGLCFSWRLAQELWHIKHGPSEAIGAVGILSFIILTFTYLIKCHRFPKLIRDELAGPVSICFFATFIVCLLLIPGILLPYFPIIATWMWSLGTVLIFAFAWHVLKKWLDERQSPDSAHPVWILPVVGTLDVPIVGSRLAIQGGKEICLVFFGIGLIFGIILMTIVISRLIFQPPLSENLQPTLLILTGPFALAFIGYDGFSGKADIVSGVFLYFNLFLLLLLASKVALISRTCPFKVSWWAVSFPLAATTVSTLIYSKYKNDIFHQVLAGILLVFTSLIVLFLFGQTLYRIVKGTFVQRK